MLENLSNLFGDVVRIAHAAAATEEKGKPSYVTPFTRTILERISKEAHRRNQFMSAKNKADLDRLASEGFAATINEISKYTKEEQLQNLSRLTALDAIVANAVNNAEQVASYPTPKERIGEFLAEYFKDAPDNEKAVDALQKKLGTMIISLTHTMHPTIYHTPEARKFEARLKGILENSANVTGTSGTLRLNEAGLKAVGALFSEKPDGSDPAVGFIENLASGKAGISPVRQTTVSMETQTEKENLAKIGEEMKAVIAAWNLAVQDFSGLASEQRQKLKIDAALEQKMIEFRTWGQSADADGREKSTSQFLYESIQNNVVDGKYIGPTLDFRQNAQKVHLPFMSALFQVKLRNSEKGRYRSPGDPEQSFADYCHEFMDSRKEKYEQQKQENGNAAMAWQGPRHSIFQQLNGFKIKKTPDEVEQKDDRAAFMSEVIRRGFKLVPDQIRFDTMAFNSGIDETPKPPAPLHRISRHETGDKVLGIQEIKEIFLKTYDKQIRDAGYDPDTIQYLEMINVTIPYDIAEPKGVQISLRGAWDTVVKLNGWEILHGGLSYSRLPALNPPEGLVLDFWHYVNPEQLLVQNFLQGTKKLGKNNFIDLSEQERATFNDTVKRLFVVKDAIEKYGPKVATRYQMANFSEPTDFLIVLKLFQDTGIATFEKNAAGEATAVKNTMLGIMPLLETGEDLNAAPVIFSKLLANPLAKSFWEKRGEAEIMLGFSDGAASVGNFASQWDIFQASRKLTELFAQHGLKVRFFQGRGRGVDRGGTIDPSLQMDLISPEAMQRAIYDVTIQSDLPTDLAASKAYGEDYLTKVLVGTLKSSLKADRPVDSQKKQHLAKLEEGIDWIAKRSAEIYQEHVRTDKVEGALKVLNGFPGNPFITSRVKNRSGDAKSEKFDDVRAIPKEYIFNGMDLKVHNVGLLQAMNEYEAQKRQPPLAELHQHPFFKAITKTIAAGMAHYDPTIALAHAKSLKAEPFVKTMIEQLDGLPALLHRLAYQTGAAAEAWSQRKSGKPQGVSLYAQSPSNVLDHISHGLIINGMDAGKPANPKVNRDDEKKWAETLYNALFVTADAGHRELPWRAREIDQAVAV